MGDSNNASGWCTIESDPGVFSELLTAIGVKGVQVSEAYSFDYESLCTLSALEDLHGLVFLFAYGADTTRDGALVRPPAGEVFFARQVITNACATQAILSIVLNIRTNNTIDIDIGDELRAFKDFVAAAGMDAESAGLTISNSERIRDAHNSFAPVTSFSLDTTNNANEKKEDPFHYVSYVPINGRLYELDGLQASPRDHGPITAGGDWRHDAARVLAARTKAFAAGELRFSLMAVVTDVIMSCERQLNSNIKDIDTNTKLRLQDTLDNERRRRARWKRENERRRTNFIPFIGQVLQAAATKQNSNSNTTNNSNSTNTLLDDMMASATADREERIAKEKAKEAGKSNKKEADTSAPAGA